MCAKKRILNRMDGNKEEALRALKLAEKYLYEKNDVDKAIKFLQKSKDMDPTNTKVDELLKQVGRPRFESSCDLC